MGSLSEKKDDCQMKRLKYSDLFFLFELLPLTVNVLWNFGPVSDRIIHETFSSQHRQRRRLSLETSFREKLPVSDVPEPTTDDARTLESSRVR